MGTSIRKLGKADVTFAENVRAARQARAMTLEELSGLMALTDTPLRKSALSKLENGLRTVTVGEAVNLCRMLDAPIGSMFYKPVAISTDVRIL